MPGPLGTQGAVLIPCRHDIIEKTTNTTELTMSLGWLLMLSSRMPSTHVHKIPILTTFDAPPGQAITRVIGPCWGITVRSRNIVGTACAGCQQIFGGEISALTELATDSRNVAMDRLEQHAMELGANAVLGMRFDSGDLMQNTNEIVAYGTAVVIAPEPRQ